MSKQKPKQNEQYRHYKGNTYEIICIARNSDTLEECVVYQGLYNSEEFGPHPLWVRPLSHFIEEIPFEGTMIQRFTRID